MLGPSTHRLIISLLLDGLSHRAIARRASVSRTTVGKVARSLVRDPLTHPGTPMDASHFSLNDPISAERLSLRRSLVHWLAAHNRLVRQIEQCRTADDTTTCQLVMMHDNSARDLIATVRYLDDRLEQLSQTDREPCLRTAPGIKRAASG